jgi:hypothetical protein
MYVAKVSLPGFDVKTATPEQMALHSGYPPLHAKLGQSPEHSATLIVDFRSAISQGVTHTIYAINHGYGYIPLTLSSINITGISGGFELYGIGYTGVGATLSIQAYSTTSQFIVTVFDSNNWISNSSELRVSYDIYAEDGT